MKRYLFLYMMLFSFMSINAADIDAIYVWVDGTSTCYKLESMPKVTFVDKTAILTLNGQNTPVLVLDVENSSDLRINFGVYKESTEITLPGTKISKVIQTGKYIMGGKLIIIKNGKKYNSNGIEIN